ncbi:MAG: carbohydrate ABC transporter permease [Firmicutes bacterium]|nr:carbohydrate ABC transporter permease [Bacillota bacterium]
MKDKKDMRYIITKVGINILLFILAIVAIYPLYWLVLNSFKTNNELFTNSLAFPEVLSFNNYVLAWDRGLSKFFLNSVYVSILSVGLTVLLGALAAYGLSRFEFKAKKLIFILILGGLMLPEQVSLVPLYKLLQKIHLYNTHWAMIVPYVAFRIPFAVFLMRSYFLSFPKDIEEAAYIDGYGSFSIFLKIVLPISKPILAAAAIMTLNFVWNEFIFALVFVENENIMTIPIGLMSFKGKVRADWTILLAGITIASIPMVALYLSMQKQFVRGLMAGSTKG